MRAHLLLMGRGVQSAYLHSAPKATKPTGRRLNLTFRRLRGEVTHGLTEPGAGVGSSAPNGREVTSG